LKQIRKRLTYANVMSTIAVFLLIGGGAAFAASKKINGGRIKAGTIKAGKLAKEAVKAGKLANNAVIESKIGDGAVTTNKIADQAVTNPKLANDAVSTDKIANDAVNTDKIANDAVSTDKIGTDAVTTGKIANDAVTADKIAANAVTTAKILNGAVDANKLGAITVQTESFAIPPAQGNSANVDCPAGQRAISGGGAWDEFNNSLSFLSTRPIRSTADVFVMADGEVPGGWRASGFNGTGATHSILVWVLCLE